MASAHPAVVSVRDMAESEGISTKYLEQILNALKRAGLVKAVRGTGGGYSLARAPAAITVRELFEAVEGSTLLVRCLERRGTCPHEELCPTRETWQELSDCVASTLERTTVQDLLDRKKRKAAD